MPVTTLSADVCEIRLSINMDPGTVLSHEHGYQIHRLLSKKGGMGLVYLATDLNMRAQVVIKQSRFNDQDFLRSAFQHLESSQLSRRIDMWRSAFEREARLLFGLRHQSLPRALNYFENEGHQFFVMELISGKDLSELLTDRKKAGHGPFPVEQVLDWADQLLDVLIYLHMEFSQPIIHRDIKPQNLKRTPKGQIILLDFGLAKGSHPEMTVFERSNPGATLAYAGPEQLGGKGTDVRSDFYSLGITLYELMTGVQPPNALQRVAGDAIQPAHEINGDITEEISLVLQQATAFHAKDRFESANHMRAALRQAAQHRSRGHAYGSLIEDEKLIEDDEQSEPEPIEETAVESPPSFVEDLDDNVELEMISIPGGSFSMGTLDAISLDGEHPRHFVTLLPFYSAKYPITQAQWQALMNSNPSNFKGENLPVENVTWHDALRFCETLSARSGRKYRLLTEAEWEYACRADTVGDYSFGNDESHLKEYAWFAENSNGTTHPVGQKRPNAMGLHDMHGNVWEWCGDWYDDQYYAQSPDFDPQGPTSGTVRVLRGGSWSDDAYSCRSARRNSGDPFSRSLNVGFRVAVQMRR